MVCIVFVQIACEKQKMLRLSFPEKMSSFRKISLFGSLRPFARLAAVLVWLFFTGAHIASASTGVESQPKSQEVSDIDGIPVLIKHLPDWESVRQNAVFASDRKALQTALGARPILDLIEFTPGTEAVAARYDAGTLLIVEFPTPQGSVEADNRIQLFLQGPGLNSQTIYRRIGNYNAMVLDVTDPNTSAALLDKVKYEKNVQWLGENPFMAKRAERSFVITTSDIFLSTVLAIVLGMGFSIVGGLAVGVAFFYLRERECAGRTEFTDAGGMTRLNLDGFTPEITSSKLLKD